MRPIEFRAWDKKENKMITSGVDFELICLSLPNPPKGYKHEGVMTPSPEVYSRFILEQLTGLKDKNGVDLDWWEGDIYDLYGTNSPHAIIFDKGCFWFEQLRHKSRVRCYSCTEFADDILKVGNIHEEKK